MTEWREQRAQPSGFVHFVRACRQRGRDLAETACGQRRSPRVFTENFPPGAKRCVMCEEAVFSAEEEAKP